MIPVTKPYSPPIKEYKKYLDGIWSRKWYTNCGPLHNELEHKLKDYLEIKNLLFVSNGTIALQIAIKALGLSGEIITTPFSYVATTSSIVWENCKPIFVDIDQNTFNIDSSKIESAITERTSAILATHVFGNPCKIDEIERIAEKHNLKVIYDAAHAFGVNYKGDSIFGYGDISTTSFHATKLFHTGEGGAVITNSNEILEKLYLLRNFGHTSPTSFSEVGINAKNSELHAAMGLCNLKYIESILDRRKELYDYYLENLKLLDVSFQELEDKENYNHAYFPIVFSNKEKLGKSMSILEENNIFPRRYFYPSLSTLPYVESEKMINAEKIAGNIICLPLYHELKKEEIDLICKLLLSVQNC